MSSCSIASSGSGSSGGGGDNTCFNVHFTLTLEVAVR